MAMELWEMSLGALFMGERMEEVRLMGRETAGRGEDRITGDL